MGVLVLRWRRVAAGGGWWHYADGAEEVAEEVQIASNTETTGTTGSRTPRDPVYGGTSGSEGPTDHVTIGWREPRVALDLTVQFFSERFEEVSA